MTWKWALSKLKEFAIHKVKNDFKLW
uniref:Uncharacterized protein n=1 Tax=Tetranychus urticae TaxID=32264 RepID=T1KTB3_TETUR